MRDALTDPPPPASPLTNELHDALEAMRHATRVLRKAMQGTALSASATSSVTPIDSTLPWDDDALRRIANELSVMAQDLRVLLAARRGGTPPTACEGRKAIAALQPTIPGDAFAHSASGGAVPSPASPPHALTIKAGTQPQPQPSIWSGFYNKTLRERYDVLALMYPRLERLRASSLSDASACSPALGARSAMSPTPPPRLSLASPSLEPAVSETSSSAVNAHPVAKLGELPVRTANLMIENCIGVLGIPLGLGLNFVIDGQHLSVPMAVEEPSVVAAASSAAKLVATHGGGFRTATSGNIMTSQIQLVDTPDISAAIASIAEHRARLLRVANTTLCPNMSRRGGGAIDIYCRVVTADDPATATGPASSSSSSSSSSWYPPVVDELTIQVTNPATSFVVVHIDVDVCEAMGANIVNTVAEGLSDEVCRLTKSRCGLRILTNLCLQRRARSFFEIPVSRLGWKGVAGEQVASRIVEAYEFAALDPFRAVTHNKGIMNGVDAAALATGQDWRALEAAAHCYASRSGRYTSLSRYEVVDVEDPTATSASAATEDGEGTSQRSCPSTMVRVLRGSLELPLAVGSKGGALQTHPGYAATHAMLHHPSARSLSGILTSVGLAQNFAAVRAIAVTGIQKGHMALHARNIAVAAGAPRELVSEVCTYMLGRKRINVETAREYLHAHELFSEIHSDDEEDRPGARSSPSPSPSRPSMFYVEVPVPHLEAPISLNIAFESINKAPQYISIMAPSNSSNTTSSTTTSSASASASSPSPPPTQSSVQQLLLGDKGYSQLQKMFLFLASMRSIVVADASPPPSPNGEPHGTTLQFTRANLALQNRLQLLSILINILLYRLLEVRPHVVGPFVRRLLQDEDGAVSTTHLHDLDARRCRELLAHVPASDDVLSTGLPLLLALCQVLHYHLEQDVAHALIRERVAAAQWRVLRLVAASFELVARPLAQTFRLDEGEGEDELGRQLAMAADASASEQARVTAFMSIHAQRWQASQLLLVDSLALAPELVTPARLEVLARIGEYMEWEGTVAHDIARYPRALRSDHVPNVFVFWLRHVRGLEDAVEAVATDTRANALVDAFRQVVGAAGAHMWQRIQHQQEAHDDDVHVSLPTVERVTQLIRDIYAGRDVQIPQDEEDAA